MNLFRLAVFSGIGCIAPAVLRAQSISIEMLDHFLQTSASSPAQEAGVPYSFEVHVRGGGAVDMTNWGPNFYRPGTSQTPDGGSPSGYTTNTGTKNILLTPNDGSDYFFQANFATAAALTAVYAASGSYGIKFTGPSAPTPTIFDSGLTFSSGTYSVATPQVTGLTNGAAWSSGSLALSTSGTTTLTINGGSFSEYGTLGLIRCWPSTKHRPQRRLSGNYAQTPPIRAGGHNQGQYARSPKNIPSIIYQGHGSRRHRG